MYGSPFVAVAMGLDTLPVAGRMMLLAVLLSFALYGFLRVLPKEPGATLNVLYCKGALLSLVLVPVLVFVLDIRVPVPVQELVQLQTHWPGTIALSVLAIWFVGVVYHLSRLLADTRKTLQTAQATPLVDDAIEARARHWQQRLNLNAAIAIRAGGAEQAWHVGPLLTGQSCHVVLPAAAVNWPTGLQDVMLLGQLAQIQQSAWRWMMFGALVRVLYWPLPWVAKLATHFIEQWELPGLRLAASAYRDPDGWQRDVRNVEKRTAGLQKVPAAQPGALLRLPNTGAQWTPPQRERLVVRVGDTLIDDVKDKPRFEDKWADTKAQKRQKENDPHEQAYWLIAVASIFIGVATTLTQVPAAPEFEPQFLNIRWQDQMLPRMHEYAGEGGDNQAAQDKPVRAAAPSRLNPPAQEETDQ